MQPLSELITPSNAHVVLHLLFDLSAASQSPLPWPPTDHLQALATEYLDTGNANQLTEEVRYLATLLSDDDQQQLRAFLKQQLLNQPDNSFMVECL